MPRRLGVCVRCGRPMALGKGSAPPERRACRACRGLSPLPYGLGRQQRDCEMCGQSFFAYARTAQRFCSKQCVGAWKHGSLVTTRLCEICGVEFKPKRGDRPGYVQRTCSRKCGVILRKTVTLTLTTPAPSCPIRVCNCTVCGQLFTSHRGRALCSDECRRRRAVAQSSASTMKRYYSDPEFRAQVLSASHNRRANKLGAGSITSPADLVTYLMRRDRGRCRAEICLFADRRVRAKSGSGRPSIDHIVPLSLGGEHTLENIQLAHLRCNLSKHNRIRAVQPLLVG